MTHSRLNLVLAILCAIAAVAMSVERNHLKEENQRLRTIVAQGQRAKCIDATRDVLSREGVEDGHR